MNINEKEMLRLENINYGDFLSVNVGDGERLASLLGGLILVVLGATRKSISGLGAVAGGAYLVYRGLTGHCFGYQALGLNTMRHAQRRWPADEPPPASVEEGDEVVESSWQSFPTSDPPSWTMGREKREE